MSYKILSIFGTRPEAIKMAPLVKSLAACSDIETSVCVTAQHRQMLDQVLGLFGIRADHDLNIMRKTQTLEQLTADVLLKLGDVLDAENPQRILVHGDTTTAMASALAAYYRKIPVGHIEAGLRTDNIYSPWPEEMNRRIVSSIADLHFAPTEAAQNNLLGENVAADSIIVTGNTVIDAALQMVDKIASDDTVKAKLNQQFSFLKKDEKMILVTAHRRENFGAGFEQICAAIRSLATIKGVRIVYPVHLNPNVREPVERLLGGFDNVHLLEPQGYQAFIYLMERAHIIMTDSGGVQEEAPSLGKPVVLMRDTTERPEAVAAGTVQLVGSESATILSAVHRLLNDSTEYQRMSRAHNPYGDGRAATRIVARLLESINNG